MIAGMSKLSPQELAAQLRWRYATKQFDASRTIPADTWEVIENSLVLTPSSFGLQPWHFFVIHSQELKDELLPHSWGQKQVTDCSHFVVLTAKTAMSDEQIDQFLKRTAEVRGSQIDTLNPYRDMMVGFTSRMDEAARLHWAKLQTYIALGQLMTTAAVLGIDACPMEGIIPAEYDRILGLADKGLTTSVACALGYRSGEDKYATAPKVRFDKKETLTVL